MQHNGSHNYDANRPEPIRGRMKKTTIYLQKNTAAVDTAFRTTMPNVLLLDLDCAHIQLSRYLPNGGAFTISKPATNEIGGSKALARRSTTPA